MAEPEYKRLTRSCRRNVIGSSGSLWLGKDHVLCVESTGYSEAYKRFYFRDIQALITRQTNTRNVWTFILAVSGAFCLLIALLNLNSIGVLITFLCFSAPLIVGLLSNLTLGPTCTCQIRTAVQTEYLPLNRIRRARKFFESIRPLIAEAQGQLTAEEIPARLRKLNTMIPSPAPGAATPDFQAPDTSGNVIDDPNLPPRIIS